MGSSAQGDGVTESYIWGPLTRLGLATAAVTGALDQALKLWVIFVFDLPAKGTVALMPLVSLTMTWNRGISYGWFQQEGPFGQWALLALKAVAVALLWIWLARAGSRLAALCARADHRRARSATASTAWPMGPWPISYFSTSKPPPGASIGTSLTSPM